MRSRVDQRRQGGRRRDRGRKIKQPLRHSREVNGQPVDILQSYPKSRYGGVEALEALRSMGHLGYILVALKACR